MIKSKAALRRIISNKTILVTGGTGSFGQTIVRELLLFSPREIRIFSRTEDKQEKMKYEFGNSKVLRFILGDVRDPEQVDRSFSGVDYVFHAAAQKQVPATEYNVLEAVKTNVIGAQHVIDASIKHGIKKAIAISTDKAVEPVNAMGMTKAIQEKLFSQANLLPNRKNTIFCCVRYGNVLGSTGSVLPLFLKQLSENKPLTVTDKNMTRFLITLPQAVDLVFTALIAAIGGEVFVPHIKSHTVSDLAKALEEMYPAKKIKVKIIGVRVGEKIDETLISLDESRRTITDNAAYVILPEITTEATRKHYVQKPHAPFRFSSNTATLLSVADLKKILKENKFFKE